MKGNKGIALIMVVSAIMLLSVIALEFVFDSNVTHRLAVNEKERLQAYYLAQSALNIMKVELKIDKQIRSLVAGLPAAQNLPINLNEPLCKQVPISTGLLRAVFSGGGTGLFETTNEGAKPVTKTEEKAEEEIDSSTVFEKERAQEFLSFEGDFDGLCEDEQSKFNLNIFANLDPTYQTLSGTNQYDMYKATLVNFLRAERFKKLFEDVPPDKISEIVRNIADWVDRNDVINDLGNITRGPEEGLYNGGGPKPRNAKFLSVSELYLVEGVEDRWFLPLEDMFTVYGDNKMNICLSSGEAVWALVSTYAAQNPNAPAINPDNDELKRRVLDAVQFGCTSSSPQASQIAADVDNVLMGGVASGQTPQQVPQQAGQQTTTSLASMITTESRYYSLKLSGQVGDTMVNIRTVMDVGDNDPKRWKTLYYKMY